MRKRLLAYLLALCMALGMLPMPAWAEGDGTSPSDTVIQSVDLNFTLGSVYVGDTLPVATTSTQNVALFTTWAMVEGNNTGAGGLTTAEGPGTYIARIDAASKNPDKYVFSENCKFMWNGREVGDLDTKSSPAHLIFTPRLTVDYRPPQLTSLSVGGYTLTPAFEPTRYGLYTVSVPSTTESITITAQPDATTEVQSGAGAHTLNVGANKIDVVVADKAGKAEPKTYEIVVTREKPKPTKDMFTVTVPNGPTYDGTPKAATAVLEDTTKNVGQIIVSHFDQDGTPCDPIDAGTYTVKIQTLGSDTYAPITAQEALTDSAWTLTILPAQLPDNIQVTIGAGGTARAGDILTPFMTYYPNAAGDTWTYQWKVGGQNAGTDSSYLVKPEDGGKEISVKITVTGNHMGNLTGTCTVDKTPVNGSVAVSLFGGDDNMIKAGSTLSAAVTGFPKDVTYTYQWYNNGQPIDSATNSTYTVNAGDTKLTVKVTLKDTTYTGEAVSAPVEVGKGVLKGTLIISGNATVGNELTAKLDNADISAENYTIAWLRDGTAIPGASAPTYTIAAADKGKAITVQVTSKDPTVSGSLVSALGVSVAATVPGAPTNLTATVGDKFVNLRWTAPADNGGAPIQRYVIKCAALAEGELAFTNQTTFRVPGLENGTEYTFTVIAVNAQGNSEASTVSATPKAGGSSSSGGGSSSSGGGGGGGGGSSSGGSTNTPSTSGGTTSVGVTPSVSNGSATANVSTSAAQTMVSDAAKNNSDNVTVKVNVPSGSTADSVTANVPASAVASLAKDTNASLTVDSPVADVVIPNSALSALGGTSGNVTVTAAKNGTDSVTVTVQKGGRTVGALSGGMRVDVPVSAAAAQAGSSLVAVLVNADGTQTVLPKSTLSGGEMKVLLDSGSATLKFVDNSKSFSDTGAHWASGAVDFVSSRDLFQGTSPSEFSPDVPMNRAMLVTVLHRLESEPSASLYSFNDVPTGSYYAEATAWAVGMGITNGMDGAFNGDGTITREMLATMLYRYVQGTNGSKGTSGSYASMGDAGQVQDWADTAMRWAVGSGIITGDNGSLRPGDPASRAEVATMLERFVTVIAK